MLIYLRVDGVVGVSFDLAILLFAGAEHGLSNSQAALNCRRGRVRVAHHAPRGPPRLLERSHGLAEIFERGAIGAVERLTRERSAWPTAPRATISARP